jgi:hypothetical protein
MSTLAGPDIAMKPQPPSKADEIKQNAIANNLINRIAFICTELTHPQEASKALDCASTPPTQRAWANVRFLINRRCSPGDCENKTRDVQENA